MAAATRVGKEDKEIESAKIYFNRDRLENEFKDIQTLQANSDGELTKFGFYFFHLHRKIRSLIESKATSPVVLRFAIEEFKALHTEFLKLYAQVSSLSQQRAFESLRDNIDILTNLLVQDTTDSATFFRSMFGRDTNRLQITAPVELKTYKEMQSKMVSVPENDLDSLVYQCYLKIKELTPTSTSLPDQKEALYSATYAEYIPLYIHLKKQGLRAKKLNEDKNQNIELRQDLAKLILTSLTPEEKQDREAILKFQDNLWGIYVSLPAVESPYRLTLLAEHNLLKLHNAIYYEEKNERNSAVKAMFFDLIELFNQSKDLHENPLCVEIRTYCSTKAYEILDYYNCGEVPLYPEQTTLEQTKIELENMLTILTNLSALSKQLKDDNSKDDNSIASNLRIIVYENIVRFFLKELSNELSNDNSKNLKKLSELIAEVDSRLRGEGTPGKLEELALFFPKQSSTGKLIAGIVCLVLAVGAIVLACSIGDAALAKELLGGGATALILIGIGLIISSRSSGLARSINEVIGATLPIPPRDAALKSQSSRHYNQ
jgi:hypothetical protein